MVRTVTENKYIIYSTLKKYRTGKGGTKTIYVIPVPKRVVEAEKMEHLVNKQIKIIIEPV